MFTCSGGHRAVHRRRAILTSPLDLPAARRTASRNGVVGAPAAVPPAPDLFPGPRPSSLEPIALPHPNSQPTKDLSRTNAVGCAPGAVLKSSIHPRAPAHRPALNRGSSTTLTGGPASPPPAMRPRPARSSPLAPRSGGGHRSTPDRRPGAAGALFVRPGRQARPPRASVAGRDLAGRADPPPRRQPERTAPLGGDHERPELPTPRGDACHAAFERRRDALVFLDTTTVTPGGESPAAAAATEATWEPSQPRKPRSADHARHRRTRSEENDHLVFASAGVLLILDELQHHARSSDEPATLMRENASGTPRRPQLPAEKPRR